jgi:streptogramin lyase
LRINDKQLSRFTASDGLSGDQVDSLYEDREGNLWVGTNGGGLDRFRAGSITTYAKEEGLAANSPFSVIEDIAGDIWIATAGGLNRLRGNQSRLYSAVDGVPDDVTSLWVDRAQTLWIGTATHGVFRMTNGRVAQSLSVHDGVPAYVVSGIIEDSKDQLWFSTLGGGLVRYAGGQTSLYTRANGLQSNVLSAMAKGANGTIWIGTNGGLNSIQKGRVQSYATKDGPSNAWIVSLYFDSRGILWIGTTGRGMFRFEHGGFTQYSVQQGLPDDTINSILEDAESNLWIGSNKGIFRISRHDLDAVAQGASQSVYPVVFGKADGMKSSETDAGTQPTAWRARDGRLWFLTTRGVVVVDPARLSFDGRLPQSRIEGMLAEQTQVNMIQPLRLAPGTHRLEFRYTAPSLSSPERTRFRYRLDGIDSQWVPGGTQRVAQYTNMSPGHYTFRVNAGSTTGGWSAQEASISFYVRPYFYQTAWFGFFCALAGIALLWCAYRLRVGWLHARAAVLEERQRIASEIHDGLAQGLSGIVFQTEAALLSMKRAPDMTSTHVAAARDLAESSLDDARYSVWSLSPPVLDQKNLLESLSSMARQFARGRVEELDIHSSGTAWSMRPEARHHMVLVAQEAISNAIQHGNAHRIAIDLTFAPDALHLTVSDDGIGFDPELSVEQPKRGYGTRNMHHRAERLGATLSLTSEVGKGTTVSLCLPRIGRLARLWRGLRGNSIARIDG